MSTKKHSNKSGSKSATKYKPIDVNKLSQNYDKSKKFDPQYMKGNKYAPPKGMTELQKINADPAKVKAKIDALLEAGRAEITTKQQLLDYPIGSLVSYLTKPKLGQPALYRSGGFLRAKDPESPYFVLQGGQQFSKISFCVQYANIQKMWVGNASTVAVDMIKPIPTEKAPTDYFLNIGKTTVFYGRDNSDVNRFMKTKKFQAMTKWYLNHKKEKKAKKNIKK